jgi:hypothetical protein
MNKKVINYLLILIGLILFFSYVWFRFMKERLPREIPFDLNVFKFIILLFICIGYLCTIILTFLSNKNTTRSIITDIMDMLYKPLQQLDHTLKYHNETIRRSYQAYFLRFLNNMQKIKYQIILTILDLIPRLILVIVFCFDVFYFENIHYLYKVIPISILILIVKYIRHSINLVMENSITNLEETTTILCYSILEKIGDFNVATEPSIQHFIKLQAQRKLTNLPELDYIATINKDYAGKMIKKLDLTGNQKLDTQAFKKQVIPKINTVVELYTVLYLYDEERAKPKYKYVKSIIFSLYLICWSYILFVSVDSLSLKTFSPIFNIVDIYEPFSGNEL